MSHRPVNVEELLRALAQEDVRPRPAFRVQLTERLIAEMAARPRLVWWRPALAGTAVLLVLLAIVGWALTPRVAHWAIFVVENGEAQVAWRRPLYFRWTRSGTSSLPAGQECLLAEGDSIVLSDDGSGIIAFPDESRLRVRGGAALVLEELDPSRLVTRVWLTAGETQAEVPTFPGRLFEVRTDAATISARSTVFRARVIAADHTYSATDEGVTRVTLLDPAQGYPSVEVPAGYEVDARIGQPLQVRPQSPSIDRLTLNGRSVEAKDRIVSSLPEIGIFGRTTAIEGDAVLFWNGQEVARSPISPEGEFRLYFQAPLEGDYTLCIAIETPDGIRSSCVPLSYRYDATPPGLLRLLEPVVPEVFEETVALRGETEPGATVRLNGDLIPVDPNGRFTARRTLQPGENRMILEACDEVGNCTRLEFVLVRR